MVDRTFLVTSTDLDPSVCVTFIWDPLVSFLDSSKDLSATANVIALGQFHLLGFAKLDRVFVVGNHASTVGWTEYLGRWLLTENVVGFEGPLCLGIKSPDWVETMAVLVVSAHLV